jgi:hypothetical protein
MTALLSRHQFVFGARPRLPCGRVLGLSQVPLTASAVVE